MRNSDGHTQVDGAAGCENTIEEQLVAFYTQHAPEQKHRVAEVVARFANDLQGLNNALKSKYGASLHRVPEPRAQVDTKEAPGIKTRPSSAPLLATLAPIEISPEPALSASAIENEEQEPRIRPRYCREGLYPAKTPAPPQSPGKNSSPGNSPVVAAAAAGVETESARRKLTLDSEQGEDRQGSWRSMITRHLWLLSLAGPWGAWVDLTQKRRRSRRAAMLSESGWSTKEVGHWTLRAAQAAELLKHGAPSSIPAKAHADMVAQEAERRIEMGKRVIKHMLRRQLALAWNHFLHCVESRRITRQLLRKAIIRMQHLQEASAFGRFVDGVVMNSHKRRLLQTITEKRKASELTLAFRCWVHCTDEILQACANQAHKVSRGQWHRGLHATFKEWHHLAADSRLCVVTCEHICVPTNQYRLKATSFEDWLTAQMHAKIQYQILVEAHKQASQPDKFTKHIQGPGAAEADRQLGMLKRVIKHMMRHQLLLAWNGFVYAVGSVRGQRDILHKVLVRLKLRLLCQTFELFVHRVHCIVQGRFVLARTLMQWINPHLPRFFDCWSEHVMEAKAERALEQAEQVNEVILNELLDATKKAYYNVDEEVSRRIQMAKSTIKRMLQHQLSKAWNHFVGQIALSKRWRQVLSRVLARMVHRTMLSAFLRLLFHAEKVHTIRTRMHNLLADWNLLLLHNSYNYWYEFSQHTRRRIEVRSPSVQHQTVRIVSSDGDVASNSPSQRNPVQEEHSASPCRQSMPSPMVVEGANNRQRSTWARCWPRRHSCSTSQD